MKSLLKVGKYELIGVSYVALIDSIGTCCDNCGRLISNIATIKHEDGTNYTIGLDCSKTLLSKEMFIKASGEISRKKKIHDKIKRLDARGQKYVLNEFGVPCYDPSTRSGYLIPMH